MQYTRDKALLFKQPVLFSDSNLTYQLIAFEIMM